MAVSAAGRGEWGPAVFFAFVTAYFMWDFRFRPSAHTERTWISTIIWLFSSGGPSILDAVFASIGYALAYTYSVAPPAGKPSDEPPREAP